MRTPRTSLHQMNQSFHLAQESDRYIDSPEFKQRSQQQQQQLYPNKIISTYGPRQMVQIPQALLSTQHIVQQSYYPLQQTNIKLEQSIPHNSNPLTLSFSQHTMKPFTAPQSPRMPIQHYQFTTKDNSRTSRQEPQSTQAFSSYNSGTRQSQEILIDKCQQLLEEQIIPKTDTSGNQVNQTKANNRQSYKSLDQDKLIQILGQLKNSSQVNQDRELQNKQENIRLSVQLEKKDDQIRNQGKQISDLMQQIAHLEDKSKDCAPIMDKYLKAQSAFQQEQFNTQLELQTVQFKLGQSEKECERMRHFEERTKVAEMESKEWRNKFMLLNTEYHRQQEELMRCTAELDLLRKKVSDSQNYYYYDQNQ